MESKRKRPDAGMDASGSSSGVDISEDEAVYGPVVTLDTSEISENKRQIEQGLQSAIQEEEYKSRLKRLPGMLSVRKKSSKGGGASHTARIGARDLLARAIPRSSGVV